MEDFGKYSYHTMAYTPDSKQERKETVGEIIKRLIQRSNIRSNNKIYATSFKTVIEDVKYEVHKESQLTDEIDNKHNYFVFYMPVGYSVLRTLGIDLIQTTKGASVIEPLMSQVLLKAASNHLPELRVGQPDDMMITVPVEVDTGNRMLYPTNQVVPASASIGLAVMMALSKEDLPQGAVVLAVCNRCDTERDVELRTFEYPCGSFDLCHAIVLTTVSKINVAHHAVDGRVLSATTIWPLRYATDTEDFGEFCGMLQSTAGAIVTSCRDDLELVDLRNITTTMEGDTEIVHVKDHVVKPDQCVYRYSVWRGDKVEMGPYSVAAERDLKAGLLYARAHLPRRKWLITAWHPEVYGSPLALRTIDIGDDEILKPNVYYVIRLKTSDADQTTPTSKVTLLGDPSGGLRVMTEADTTKTKKTKKQLGSVARARMRGPGVRLIRTERQPVRRAPDPPCTSAGPCTSTASTDSEDSGPRSSDFRADTSSVPYFYGSEPSTSTAIHIKGKRFHLR